MTAKRSLGQHFLVDGNLQRKIVAALEAGADDEVLEIGPGRGELSAHLEGRVRRLLLVEKDDDLAEALRRRFGHRDDVLVVHDDFLDVDVAGVTEAPEELRVIGNIPYNITAPILFELLERPRPRRIVVMVQREVADRIVAEPGGKEYGALSVGIRMVAEVEEVVRVPRHVFRPVPRVDSTVVRIDPLRPAPLTPREEVVVRTLVRTAFRWRRKQLQKTLRSAPEVGLSKAEVAAVEEETGFDLRARPETLSPGDFVRLARAVEGVGC